MPKTIKDIDIKDAKCTSLTIDAPVAKLSEDQTASFGSDFIIKAYTGKAVNRWWGKLAIDIGGISAKPNIPILRNHDEDKIVGYSKKSWANDSFKIAGKFSNVTADGKEARDLLEEGFPWQASIGVIPKKIVKVENNEKFSVNGREVTGPAEIWATSEVFETSFCPCGADDETTVSRFSKFTEIEQNINNNVEVTQMTITLERLESEAPDLLRQIQSESIQAGAKMERDRIRGVSELSMKGHEELVTTLMYDGKTTKEQAALQVLQAEKVIRENLQTQLNSNQQNPVPQPPPESQDQQNQSLSVEESAKLSWDKNKSLRDEFSGEFDAYLAYEKAISEGLVKIASKREAK